MSDIPSILLVDDGELDRVQRILKKLGREPARQSASKLRGSVEKPRDLLIMSWHPTRELPELHDNAEGSEPTRVCLHSQDFLPLRERLKELGVDYLVQTALDDQSLRLFLLHRLHKGPERRAELRLPLGGNVVVRAGDDSERAKLAELSATVCRVMTAEEIPPGDAVTVVLPKGLGGDRELELSGMVIRSAEAEAIGGRPAFTTVVRFDVPDDSTRAQLDKIIGGHQIGTRVTPLRTPRQQSAASSPALSSVAEAITQAAAREGRGAEPAPASEGAASHDPTPLEQDDRRAAREAYSRRVALIDAGGELALGRDLSRSGVCITGAPAMPAGTRVTLALYGDPRGEPVLATATVVRAEGDELGLRFEALDESQQRAIEGLMHGPSMVESLRGNAADGRRIVSKVIADW